MNTRKGLLLLPILSLIFISGLTSSAQAAFTANRVMDDPIFDNFNSMNASQIDTWLNGFSNSCISTNRGFSAPDPTGYSPNSGFSYGSPVSAGRVISDASQAYGINPQVLITTLQKEEGIVRGDGPYGCGPLSISASAGYACTDSDTASHTYTYTNGTDSGTLSTPLYYTNGNPINSVSNTCVNSPLKAGFTEQLIRAAWLLKFGEQRSKGNVGWSVVKGNWNNADDPQTCYGGPMTQGSFKRCPSDSPVFYDGYSVIDGTSTHMDTGATAAFYWYTPHFHGNQIFSDLFTSWFGATLLSNLPGCTEATNTTRACVWNMLTPGSNAQYLTSSVKVRDLLYTNSGYQYAGNSFFANAVSLAGNIPVYSASQAGAGSFITTDVNEYNAVVAGGYTGNGVDFYADPAWSNTGYPVYRLYSPPTGKHYWTTSSQEVQANVQTGWNYEGVAFTSISPVRQEVAPPAGKLLVYRFYIPQTFSHFWTTDFVERDNMIKAGYSYEGVAWYSSSDTSHTPVYRLYAPSLNQHLYTTSLSEKNNLAASGGWQYEGISQYVSSVSNSSPVYRLYAPSLGVHHLTMDPNERAHLLSSGRWNDEGVAWYQP